MSPRLDQIGDSKQLGLQVGQVREDPATGDARPTERGYCWVSRFPVQPNLRAATCQYALIDLPQ